MMGVPEDPGIVPRMCGDIFAHIEARESENLKFRVEVSYYEVYNEEVRCSFLNRNVHLRSAIGIHDVAGVETRPYV
jgi:hypothetical protein